MSRKKSINTLPRMSKSQKVLWNDIYLYGQQELMSQRQRRTAFKLQQKIGRENVEIFSPEWNDSLEFIQFKQDFAKRIGSTSQNRTSYEHRIDKTTIK